MQPMRCRLIGQHQTLQLCKPEVLAAGEGVGSGSVLVLGVSILNCIGRVGGGVTVATAA